MRALPSVLLLAAAQVVFAGGSVTALNFDSLVDGTPVTYQFQAITFQNATAITAGVTLNEFEFPPHSGANVLYDSGGPMTVSFLSPVQSFTAYFTYGAPLSIRVFDASGAQLAVASSFLPSNEALSGLPGSAPNERIQVNAAGISRMIITGSLSGSSFTLDDLVVSAYTPCDLDRDGAATPADAQTVATAVLGASSALGDLNWDGAVDILDAQIVVNAEHGGTCGAATVMQGISGLGSVPYRRALSRRTDTEVPPTVGVLTLSPAYIPVNIQSSVSIAAAIGGAGVLSNGINLLRLSQSTTAPRILGSMQLSGGSAAIQVLFDELASGTVPLIVSAAFQNVLCRVQSAASLSVWSSYQSAVQHVLFDYPPTWTLNTLPESSYFTDGDIEVMEISFSALNGAASLLDFAQNEIYNNNCPAVDSSGAPVDHIIRSDVKSVTYVLSCSATTDYYNYIALSSSNQVVKLTYHDDFDPAASEDQKLLVLQRILGFLTTY